MSIAPAGVLSGARVNLYRSLPLVSALGRRFVPVLVVAGIAGLAGLAAGCDDSPTSPSNYAPYSQTDLVVGTGGDAVVGRDLTVSYTGYFYGESRPDKKGPIFTPRSAASRSPSRWVLVRLSRAGIRERWE